MTRLPLFDRSANETADAAKVKRSERPTLDELRARHGPTWGIKTTADAELGEGREQQARRAREFVDRRILAEYARLGQEPVYAGDDMLVSPSLVAALKKNMRTQKPTGGRDYDANFHRQGSPPSDFSEEAATPLAMSN